jgi:hypothetical protein
VEVRLDLLEVGEAKVIEIVEQGGDHGLEGAGGFGKVGEQEGARKGGVEPLLEPGGLVSKIRL